MKSEELQRLTASGPLSLEQKYEMRCSWQEDTDKCTFIIHGTDKWSRQLGSGPGSEEVQASGEDCMVGNVNLFLTDSEDPTLGKIEVMIGEASYCGRGFGKEATQILMSYGMTCLGLVTFEAKIGLENKASISMFKKLHFKEVGVNSVFQEITLRLKVDEQGEWLLEQTSHVDEKKYSIMKLQNQACNR
ncbi:alpha/beta-tubulin-N-acetyltransferase 9-like [Heteronotia binoei]|uniref:alpha/beta-tubulin-N-acetyltransferase 9-like n=1 Tax=Heteronotia binoei TaxID=13085 RepID=UPI002930ED79|nr:alpha/beta-tubulin-N-acetyltransferase 9-like [Heteronotia binoei]